MEKKSEDVNPQSESLALIKQALLDPDVQPEKLQQLLVIKKEWEADEARKSYARSIVLFQQDCPIVKKERKMRGTISFAGKSDIERVIKPVLAEHGLSVSIIKSVIADGMLNIEGQIMHKDGHIQPLMGSVVVDKQMSANATQQIGSAMSYAWRYMICPALNITLADEVDDDAQLAGGAYISEKQGDEIEAYIGNLPEGTREKILIFANCDSIDKIEESKFHTIVNKLKASIKKQEGES